MNLFIIGNGLDRSHGLKTGYQEYWDSPYSKELRERNLVEVPESFPEGYEKINWFNLEEELELSDYDKVVENSSNVGYNDYGADDWSDDDHHRHMQEFEIFHNI